LQTREIKSSIGDHLGTLKMPPTTIREKLIEQHGFLKRSVQAFLDGHPEEAQPRRGVPAEAAFHPAISPEMGLKRLRKLLEQIPEVRALGPRSAPLSNWEKNVKIALAELSGEDSLIFKEFHRIWFTPSQYYPGQPQSDFVDALNSGLDKATGFQNA
jgi:hypothetical protein